MVDGVENPYRADLSASDLFVGRVALVADIVGAVIRGRNTIRAVMGGRGIGKTSLARRLERELEGKALTVVTSGTVDAVAREIGIALGAELDGGRPVEALRVAVERQPSQRVVLIVDEIESVLHDSRGVAFLGNLREAYERTQGKLAIVVMGGTSVRDLLHDEASPFLRVAGPIQSLTGLTLSETAKLLRDPLRLDLTDDVVCALWGETGGHPWLLQMFMEIAVDRAAQRDEVAHCLPEAIREAEARLRAAAFPIWWANFRERGQRTYRLLNRSVIAVPRGQWVAQFGNDPVPWLDVLSSTGIAHVVGDEVIGRGTLFRNWVEQNHPERSLTVPHADDGLDAWLSATRVDSFERLVVRSLAAWARATTEFPAAAVRAGRASGNAALQPEAFFQIHALVALLQHEHDIVAEPEALSMGRATRSDIKTRSRHDPTRRACIELKIYGRDDEEVVSQVIGYSAPGDTFAAVISVDRAQRPLRPMYEARCFKNALPINTEEPPAGVPQPSFFTDHARVGLDTIRVWHFLVSLRDA